jgi:DNA-binding HxlR family transcriptional regulator
MLTQTLRQMERDGLITRTVHPVIPPRVEYKLTRHRSSLGAAFCGVWVWAEQHLSQVEKAAPPSTGNPLVRLDRPTA